MTPNPAPFYIPLNRRRLLRALMATSAGVLTSSAFAEALLLTPRLTEGPYYPDQLPLDRDNDLIRISDHLKPALGTITNISGRILDPKGEPIRNAVVELWQADNNGCYIHSRGAGRGPRDADFQGYGKFETASDGGYRFRTIKPGLYTGRTRHYHFAVTTPGRDRRFTTQLFFAGEPQNATDMVLRGIPDEARRAAVIREFKALPDSPELATTWDIVLGLTPSDAAEGEDRQQRPPPPPARGGGSGRVI